MTVESASGTDATTPNEPRRISGETELAEFVADNAVVLVDFYADWCGPCQMLEPVVDLIATETAAAVAKVDVDANQQLAGTYGVRGVPTLILFADGEPVEEIVGVRGEDQLRQLIGNYTR